MDNILSTYHRFCKPQTLEPKRFRPRWSKNLVIFKHSIKCVLEMGNHKRFATLFWDFFLDENWTRSFTIFHSKQTQLFRGLRAGFELWPRIFLLWYSSNKDRKSHTRFKINNNKLCTNKLWKNKKCVPWQGLDFQELPTPPQPKFWAPKSRATP